MTIDLPASFYLGKKYDLKSKTLIDEPLNYSARDLTTHAVIVGMTGSGKTGLGITLLEEAALDGIPELIIDPKGDLTNLLLTFPQLRPEDFLPWMESDFPAAPSGQADGTAAPGGPPRVPDGAGAAAGGDGSPVAEATRVAAEWKAGLAQWGIDGARIQRLRDSVDVTIYTPGSEAGVPVNILDALRVPPGSRPQAVEAAMQDSGGVLPSSPSKLRHSIFYIAHLSDAERLFFLSLLLQQVRSWMRAQPGTSNLRALLYFDDLFGYLPPYPHNPSTKTPLLFLLKNARAYGLGLLPATQNPIDLDYKALTNAGTWFIGKLQTQYDKARLLDGLQTVAGEQQASSLLQSPSVPGRRDRRADDYALWPPQGERPPQNAATLKGERPSAGESAGSLNREELNDAIGMLDPRVFLYHNVHRPPPIVFKTRWAMSYLKGPLTRPQIRSLMAHASAQLAATMAARSDAPADRTTDTPGDVQAAGIAHADAPSAWATAQTTISVVSPEIAQYYLPPARILQLRARRWEGQRVLPPPAPTRPAYLAGVRPEATTATPAATTPMGVQPSQAAAQPPAQPATSGIYQPYLLAVATITFDDRRTGTRHSVSEARLLAADQNGAPLDWVNSEPISLEAKDLQTTPSPAARFAGLPNGFANPQKLGVLQRSFVQYLYRESKLVLRRNKQLKIVENPEETEGAFRQRCAEAAHAGLEAEQQKIKTKYAKQLDRLAELLQREQNELSAEQKELEGRKHEELWTNIESIAAFLGFGRAYRPLSTASRRRRQTEVTASTIQDSRDTIESLKQKLTDLQKELDSELQDSRAKWVAAQDAIDELKLMPRKTDIHIDAFGIAWRP